MKRRDEDPDNRQRITDNRLARGAGLARAEWIIILGVMVIVLAILLPSAWALYRRGLHGMVRSDMIALIQAGTRFFEDYEAWPTEHTGEYGDFRYGLDLPNREVIHVLLARDAAGNRAHGMNTRKVVYIEIEPYARGVSGLSEENDMLDPWGNPYQIVLDTDLNNTCNIDRSRYPPVIGEGMVVWSMGPDGVSDTRDDIVSWKIK